MTTTGIVTRLIDQHNAEVEVERGTACGGNCGSCEACVFQNTIRTVAKNRVSALPGQRVTIESKTSDVLGAAALLYIVPFILFFIGYAIAAALHLSEGLCILAAAVFFAVGIAANVIMQRNRKKASITFDIIAVQE
jgi:sigma-E factor negative regulatory protein RseC